MRFLISSVLLLIISSCTSPSEPQSEYQDIELEDKNTPFLVSKKVWDLDSLSLIKVDGSFHFETPAGKKITALGQWQSIQIIFSDITLAPFQVTADTTIYFKNRSRLKDKRWLTYYILAKNEQGQSFLLNHKYADRPYSVARFIDDMTDTTEAFFAPFGSPKLPKELTQYPQLKQLIFTHADLIEFPFELISTFKQLERLDLRNNRQFNQSPKLELPNLKVLELAHSYWTDSLGKMDLSQCNNLEVLDLHFCGLESLPIGINKLQQLKYLDLSVNYLKALPENFGDLNTLEYLDLKDNALKTLPANIGKLSNLRTLNIKSNNLERLPSSIGKLQRLKSLNIEYNDLENLPEDFCNLTTLVSLDVSNNKLIALPQNIGQLRKLSFLSLGSNALKSLPPTTGQLDKLESLNLNTNFLQKLPQEMENLSNLKYLDLHSNLLEELSFNFSKLARLKNLGIYYEYSDKKLPLNIDSLKKTLPNCSIN